MRRNVTMLGACLAAVALSGAMVAQEPPPPPAPPKPKAKRRRIVRDTIKAAPGRDRREPVTEADHERLRLAAAKRARQAERQAKGMKS